MNVLSVSRAVLNENKNDFNLISCYNQIKYYMKYKYAVCYNQIKLQSGSGWPHDDVCDTDDPASVVMCKNRSTFSTLNL